jgi:uncharacterized protein YidB (DUF937 family)
MANSMLGKVILGGLAFLLYKNRDRLADAWNPGGGAPDAPQGAGGNDDLLRGGGLGEILDRFRNAGKGDAVDSWIGKGNNQPLDPSHVEEAIDADTLDALEKQTGLSRHEILRRLAVNLPEAVDELSLEGNLPEAPKEPTLLDSAPAAPRTAGASVPNVGASKSVVADRNLEGDREAGMMPRPTDKPIG